MMSNVMSNRRGNIAKQIFLSLGLFFSFSQLGAMCPQTVGAITPGEAIWRVVSRVGLAANTIQSQLCLLATGSSATGVECTFTFGQSDIGSGGVYIISAPGTYCMKENVAFTTGSAITVNSNDVTIDLQGHTMNGGGNIATAIELAGGVQNVIIENGIIENLLGPSPDGIGIRDTVAHISTLRNITIQNMNFNNNEAAISFNQADVDIYDVDGIVIRNCRSENSGRIFIQGLSGVVENCEVNENRGGGIQGGITAQGVSTLLLANSFLIRDCVSTSFLGANLVPIALINVQNVIVQNCVVHGGLTSVGFGANSSGIFIDLYEVASISDCVVQGCLRGFNPVEPLGGSLLIERCAALSAVASGFEILSNNLATPTKLIDCVAENCGFYGFVVLHIDSTSTLSDVTFKGCSATGCGESGFAALPLNPLTTISHLVYEDCVAQSNGGHGFEVIAGPLSGSLLPNIVHDVLFTNCVAQGNAFDGFALGTSDPQVGATTTGPLSGAICINCTALDNVNGFNFGSTVTLSKILDCCALNNTSTGINNQGGAANAVLGNAAFNNGFDISGVPDATLLVSRSNPGALAGGTIWVNAIS
jgi:hypothetical protein